MDGLQDPIPEGLSHWYEYRVDRLIAVSVDLQYQCSNQEPVPDHKLIVFEDGARWSEFRGDAHCRCRLLSESEMVRLAQTSSLSVD